MTRRAVGTLIVASWAVCMGWLVVRQTVRPDEEFLEAASSRLAPGASFYQVTVNGTPIGNSGITIDTTLTGYRLTEVWSIDIASSGEPERHVLRSDAALTRSFKLEQQSISLSEAGVGRILEADQNDGAVTLRQWRPGSPPETVGRMTGEGVTVPGALPFRLVVEKRLEPGRRLGQTTASVFSGRLDTLAVLVQQSGMLPVADSAVWDSTQATWLPVDPTPRAVWQVQQTGQGMPVLDWIDQQGHLVRRTWAFGVTLERSPFEVNYNTYQTALRQGTITLPRLPGDRLRAYLPGQPDSSVRLVRVAVARNDGPAWPGATAGFTGPRQSVSGDTVTIVRESAANGAPPGAGDYREPADQSPALARALGQALGTRSGDTLSALVGWVHSAIRAGNEESPAEPAVAARSRQASPEGKVRLLVELARHAGLPARAVIGLDLGHPARPAHTWAEVWQNGRWISADPWYGHLPASATLLRVADGANARPLVILPLVAALQTTTLTTTR